MKVVWLFNDNMIIKVGGKGGKKNKIPCPKPIAPPVIQHLQISEWYVASRLTWKFRWVYSTTLFSNCMGQISHQMSTAQQFCKSKLLLKENNSPCKALELTKIKWHKESFIYLAKIRLITMTGWYCFSVHLSLIKWTAGNCIGNSLTCSGLQTTRLVTKAIFLSTRFPESH